MFFDFVFSPITSSSPRHNTQHQARKIARTMLHTSSSCWTPMTRKLLSTVFLKLGTSAPLKKLRNLKLSLGRISWRFWIWLRGLYSVKLISRC